jgi:hypothetical protein
MPEIWGAKQYFFSRKIDLRKTQNKIEFGFSPKILIISFSQINRGHFKVYLSMKKYYFRIATSSHPHPHVLSSVQYLIRYLCS